VCTLPLHGTFGELYALMETVCADRPPAAARLRHHLASWPTAATVLDWAAEAGLAEVELVCAPFSVLLAGGLDLFFAPMFEYGPLTAWKSILGGVGPEMQLAFGQLKDAIDRTCRGERSAPRAGEREPGHGRPRPLCLTVRAVCLRARRPLPPADPGAAATDPALARRT
jgi:hypothetical protein